MYKTVIVTRILTYHSHNPIDLTGKVAEMWKILGWFKCRIFRLKSQLSNSSSCLASKVVTNMSSIRVIHVSSYTVVDVMTVSNASL
jgi:hypothetical protein